MATTPIAALALAAALAAPALALAQADAGPAPPPPGGRGHMGHPMEAQARLHALHEILRIRPDQDAAFQAYAAAMRPDPKADGWRHAAPARDHAATAPLTTPERLDRMATMMDERENRRRAAFERRAAATKTLYAALSPDQRRVMDALPQLEGHGGQGWGGHEGMGRGMDGGPQGPMPPMGPPPPRPPAAAGA